MNRDAGKRFAGQGVQPDAAASWSALCRFHFERGKNRGLPGRRSRESAKAKRQRTGTLQRLRLSARTTFILSLACSFSGISAPALEWQDGSGYRSAVLNVTPGGRAGFTMLPPSDTGIFFTNVLPQSRALTNQVLLSGSGVAAGDVDGDGWCDLYFCGLNQRNA